MEVDRKQKEELLRKVSNLVEQKYFDPEFDVPKWDLTHFWCRPTQKQNGSRMF
jgi:hypothetical protein